MQFLHILEQPFELHKECFLEPLNPIFPADDQEITCPSLLVRETIILLNDE